MNKLLLSIMAVAVSATFATSAMAGVRDHNVNKHQHHQDRRIAQGVKSGELTRGEAKDLRGDQKERQELHQDQHAASKEIYQEKHDEQERPRAN